MKKNRGGRPLKIKEGEDRITDALWGRQRSRCQVNRPESCCSRRSLPHVLVKTAGTLWTRCRSPGGHVLQMKQEKQRLAFQTPDTHVFCEKTAASTHF